MSRTYLRISALIVALLALFMWAAMSLTASPTYARAPQVVTGTPTEPPPPTETPTEVVTTTVPTETPTLPPSTETPTLPPPPPPDDDDPTETPTLTATPVEEEFTGSPTPTPDPPTATPTPEPAGGPPRLPNTADEQGNPLGPTMLLAALGLAVVALSLHIHRRYVRRRLR